MKTCLFILGLTAAALAFGGCGPPNDVSTKAIVHDLSPEMHGLVETSDRANANLNITLDMNTRMFYDDIGRALYTDQPSRLTPVPVSAPTGIPR